jgi:nucleoside-diphosphate-sugar epimerase
MADERFFVTGALGCLGAWVVRNLISENLHVTVYDLGSSRHRLELLMEPEEIARIDFVQDDITDTEAVARAVEASGANRIIHLAALQVPFCKANPSLGAAVNVVGTVNVFEAAKRAGISSVVYASSMAVYGGADLYGPEVQDGDPLHPLNLYGVYKGANEGTARIYWQDDGIASLALRPYTVYGPARDQGMTSTPTQAMLAAAKDEDYHISFGGTCGYQYADDVAQTFIALARLPYEGASVFNVRGSVAHMSEVVDAIVAAEPSAAGRITYEETPLPFAEAQNEQPLQSLLKEVPYTPLKEGVARTVDHFRQALAAGKIE